MSEAAGPNTMDVEQEQESEQKAVEKEANKSKSKANKKKSRKRKFDETDKDGNDNDNGPPKKKKKRGWTESEETLYREGLDLYGRDWKAVAKHVGTHRDAASIRSHSQIYFLKLLAQHKPLPPKVAESGTGYTLGGNPLNKYSSIAIRHFGSPSKVPMIDGVISDQEAAEKSKRPKKNKKNATNDDKQKKTKKSAQKKKKKKKRRNKYYDSTDDEDSDIYEDSKFHKLSITTTTQRRSGRSCTRNRNFTEQALHETEPYTLRTEMEYYSPFIPPQIVNDNNRMSGDDDDDHKESVRKKKRKKNDNTYNQPFEVSYCPNALLIADIHSHLCRSVEIMGLLGGTYDSDKRVLLIKKCYPILEEEQHEQTVSADPADHLMTIQRMREQDGLELVGWYHSHPCFENFPSNTDCHQHFIHKYENEVENPYIGLIISSWSTDDILNGVSNYRFFNIIQEFKYIYTPLQLMTKIKVDKDINDDGLWTQIEDLINRYSKMKYDIYRSNFGEAWDVNPNLNLGQKAMKSIRGHLVKKSNDNEEDCDRDEDKIGVFMEKIEQLFVEKGDVWWITNKPKQKRLEERKEEKTITTMDSDNSDSLSSKENKNSLNE